MSLESQIANLVDAANNLTSEVAGKMSQIDNKVDAATQAVPNTIREFAKQVFYVDAQYGDDNNSGGEESAPLKTIRGVGRHVVSGSEISIYLRAGQVHEVTGFGFYMSTGMIGFHCWGDYQTYGKPEIRFRPVFDQEKNSYRGYVVGLSTGNIVSRFCDLTVDFDALLGTLDTQASFFAYSNSAISVVLHQCDIKLRNAPLIAAYSGYSGRDLYLSLCSVEVVENSTTYAKLVNNRNGTYHTMKLDVYNTALVGDLTWKDLIDVYPDGRNVLSNINFTTI
ncbi:hypothetical protein [Vreelandella venusta]|uniref:hypothetical protein n=1 Tax=Vreelandella venusta TaxID=44935 RepID=UPI00201003BF|nr:hypothetical protein [Halomonas venusta]UQI40964.1 hypothetical protein M3L73_01510 [Halomonas venusta]